MHATVWLIAFVLSVLFGFALIVKTRIRVLSGIWIALISGIAAALCAMAITDSLFWLFLSEGLFIVIFSLMIMAFMFFRDPERKIPLEPGLIVSPADGQVIYIKNIEKSLVPVSEKKSRTQPISEMLDTDLLNDGCVMIGIEMNILNVHVNRAVMAGEICFQKHSHGKFLSLRNPEAAWQNERVTTVIDNGTFKTAMVQIASRLVRKIVSYKKAGDSLKRGERFGMIKFGSQVDVILPGIEGLNVKVSAGAVVKAGESIIAEYKR